MIILTWKPLSTNYNCFSEIQLHMLRDIKFMRGFSFKITAKKMKFSINDFFSKCKQICGKLRIWTNLLKKVLVKNVDFCALNVTKDFDWIKTSCKRFMKVRKYLSFLYSASGELHKPYFRPHHVKRFIKTNMELVCIDRK